MTVAQLIEELVKNPPHYTVVTGVMEHPSQWTPVQQICRHHPTQTVVLDLMEFVP